MKSHPEPSDAPDCVRCRHGLLLTERGPHPLPQDAVQMQGHLATCPNCRAYAQELAAWRHVGQRLRTTQTAPAAVRQRMFRGLALARTRGMNEQTPRRTLARTAAIVVLALGGSALVGLSLWRFMPQPTAADSASTLVEDHWRDLHQQSIDSADPAAVQQWVSQRVAIPVRVEKLPGATLLGARLCFLRGRMGAVLRYRVDGSNVAYYVMPASTHAADADADGTAIRQESAQGFNVLLWQDRGLLHALVSDLSRARLHLLAASCKGRDA